MESQRMAIMHYPVGICHNGYAHCMDIKNHHCMAGYDTRNFLGLETAGEAGRPGFWLPGHTTLHCFSLRAIRLLLAIRKKNPAKDFQE